MACDGGGTDDDATMLTDPDGDGVAIQGSQIQIDLTSARGASIAEEGGFLFIEEAGTLVINAGGSILAFTSVCTRDSCAVDRFEAGFMHCSCDEAVFNDAGEPVNGTAPSALARYIVTRSADLITVVRTSSEPDPPSEPDPEPPPYGY